MRRGEVRWNASGRLNRRMASSRWTECQIPDLYEILRVRLKVAWSNRLTSASARVAIRFFCARIPADSLSNGRSRLASAQIDDLSIASEKANVKTYLCCL